MRLVHFAGSDNFGDELNQLVWPELAGDLFTAADRTGFLGIGTIIGMPTPGCDLLHIFSSGVGYDRLDGWNMPHRVWCVRGPLTANMLGADADTVLTDGAVLTPLVLPQTGDADTQRQIGVMPHWQSLRYPGWRRACDLAGFTLISPIGAPASVIRALRATRLLITESLHGAIIADSYGIPWVAMATSGNFSVFKWMDWCLSMQVPLRVSLVPPPSLDPLLQFGRPRQGAWGEVMSFSADDAEAEFRLRVDARSDAPAPRARRGLLRTAVERSRPLRSLAGVAAGFRPARTAEHLTRAASVAPTLSHPAMAETLRERMMERLAALRQLVARETVA